MNEHFKNILDIFTIAKLFYLIKKELKVKKFFF